MFLYCIFVVSVDLEALGVCFMSYTSCCIHRCADGLEQDERIVHTHRGMRRVYHGAQMDFLVLVQLSMITADDSRLVIHANHQRCIDNKEHSVCPHDTTARRYVVFCILCLCCY